MTARSPGRGAGCCVACFHVTKSRESVRMDLRAGMPTLRERMPPAYEAAMAKWWWAVPTLLEP